MMENKEIIEINSREYWFKIVEFLQQNWALIEQQNNGTVRLFFINDSSGVFDSMDFENKHEAEKGLVRNGFHKFADDLQAQKMIQPPNGPFLETQHPNGPIYSSGRFWK